MFRRVPLLVWFLIPTMIVVGLGVWFLTKTSTTKPSDSDKPLAVSKPVEGTQEFTIVSRQHITDGTVGSGYNSNPPTSGPHWSNPAKNGVYDSSLPDEELIHNLEHGYVWVSYKSNVGDDVKNKLKEIVNSDSWKVVLEPRDKDDAKVELASWGRLLKMDDVNFDKVKDFIKTYRNRGPEQTPD